MPQLVELGRDIGELNVTTVAVGAAALLLMTHIDSAGLQALEDLAGTLDADGIALHFARAKPPVADLVAERVKGARFHGTVRAAVQTATLDEA